MRHKKQVYATAARCQMWNKRLKVCNEKVTTASTKENKSATMRRNVSLAPLFLARRGSIRVGGNHPSCHRFTAPFSAVPSNVIAPGTNNIRTTSKTSFLSTQSNARPHQSSQTQYPSQRASAHAPAVQSSKTTDQKHCASWVLGQRMGFLGCES